MVNTFARHYQAFRQIDNEYDSISIVIFVCPARVSDLSPRAGARAMSNPTNDESPSSDHIRN